MLIFLVCLNVLALSIFLMWYGKEKNNEDINMGGFALCAIACIILFALIVTMICCGVGSREKATQLNIDYANLEYYITHLDDYKERTVIESVNRYNAELKSFRAKQQSPWLNWFYPGDLSECGYIIWKD